MITITNKQDCSGCYACYSACPTQCIQMKADIQGFEYPAVDKSLCVECRICEEVCQKSKKRLDAARPVAYGAKAKSDETRLKSSSGGIFTLLSEWVLRKNGVVYGAAMVNGADVEHIRISQSIELDQLCGSKYVQSRIGTAYTRVKEDLDRGLWVLFTGTPCQIGGLRNFLREKNYETLLCQDILCHGVPPQKAWKKYLSEKGFDTQKDMKVSFRDKSTGWSAFSVVIQQGRRLHKKRFLKDSYMRAFLSDIMLRPSCYDCSYKNMSYRADITVGDFWGIERVAPDFADEYGISLVFNHSAKGKLVFEEIKQEMDYKNVTVEEAIQNNMNAVMGAREHGKRTLFFAKIDEKPFEWLVAKYVKGKLWIRAIRYIKRKLR